MSEGRVERRLAAILAVDVAGYSRLMGEDEEVTLATLRAHRQELGDPKIAKHRGRSVKTTGDGVNIAARLEALAEPGGICISAAAHEQVRDKIAVLFEDMGEQQVKNIARPVHAYRVVADGRFIAEPPPPALARTLPDKPSIAVLPFHNMSGDPEQEYFVDGIVEDIITGLSRIGWLHVIARNSTFVYKGRAVDVKQIGRELGVRYVLEGSMRKADSRVRVTAQLDQSPFRLTVP